MHCNHCHGRTIALDSTISGYRFLGGIYSFHKACARDVEIQANRILWFTPLMEIISPIESKEFISD